MRVGRSRAGPSRAAIFSAALAACTSDKAKAPTPAPPPAQGSDDLEQLLDNDGRTVAHPNAPPPVDAAVADAAPADAGVPDAPPPDAGVVKKRKRRQQVQKLETIGPDDDLHHQAKPYGAPPARRRAF